MLQMNAPKATIITSMKHGVLLNLMTSYSHIHVKMNVNVMVLEHVLVVGVKDQLDPKAKTPSRTTHMTPKMTPISTIPRQMMSMKTYT